ncbi:hypothetical protein VTH06DRAFT_7476 [Thermothelomyces fergusii]
MDRNATRYSIDIGSLGTGPSKFDHEEAELLPDDSTRDPDRPDGQRESHKARKRDGAVNLLLVVLVVLVVLLGISTIAGWVLYWRTLPGTRLMGEINGLIPEFPVVPVLFGDDPLSTPDHTTAASANATHEYWLSFMPIGNGFMAVDHDDKHILPPPMVQGQEYYSIAVFHQLHCLYSIMKMWNQMNDDLDRAKRGQPMNRDGAGEGMHHPDLRRHMDHCFRYLRQTIVCCGDTALEGQNPKAKIPDTDGSGATHLCKDFGKLKAWAEERRLNEGHAI